MKRAFLSLAVFALAVPALADVLKLDAGSKAIEGVNVAKSGVAVVQGRSNPLTAVGAGLRSKKVAIVQVKVYVAQVLVSDASKFVRSDDGALASLGAMNTAAIQLSFLRTLGADKIQSALQESLAANKVNTEAPEIRAVLAAVSAGAEATEGRSAVMVAEKLADGTEAVTYQDTTGKAVTISGPAGFTRSIFSIWFGVAADDGIAKLRKSILAGNGL